jgi:apolipoprotein N-acyltransferase
VKTGNIDFFNGLLWQEYSVAVTEEHEQEFIDRASRLAKENNIYLAMAVAVFPLSYPDRPWQNKLVWVGPDGKIIAEYLKSKPAPPLEPIAPGGDVIPILDTPYGKIASVICADLDYPGLLHQGRVHEADILLIPAQDWAAADPLHTEMSVFRAIENGVSMVKGTGGGLSIAVDPYGRVINAADYLDPDDAPMIACLPVGGVRTIYSMIGDAFAWLCILGVVAMSIRGYVVKKRRAQSV